MVRKLRSKTATMKIPNDAKRHAIDAISNTETLSQIAAVKMTGGVALYAARIRQMDRESGFAPQKGRRTAFRSAIERDI